VLSILTNETWADAQVTLDDGGGAQTYTLLATDNSAYQSIASLVAFGTAQFAATFSFSWQAGANGGTDLILSATAGFTMASNTAAQALMGWPASSGSASSHTASASASGTLDPAGQKVAVRRSYGVLEDDAPASGTGAAREGVPGLSLHPTLISSVLTAEQCARLQLAWGKAANPRQAWVYQDHTSTWRLVALGAVSLEPTGGNLWRFGADVAGGLE
jgi:hypothetical protein